MAAAAVPTVLPTSAMPSGPKGKFMNRHAAEAKERDSERKAETKRQAERARDDAAWADDDKQASRKANRAQEKTDKAAEAQAKKLQREQELAREEAELTKAAPAKVTRRDAQREVTRMATEAKERVAAGRDKLCTDAVHMPSGNVNAAKPSDSVDASGLADADRALSGGGRAAVEDRHIGRRARVAYKAFCELNLPRLKEQKKLRRTQYNDMLWAMWQKSPENPFVQRAESMADDQVRRKWFEASDDDE